MIDDGHPVFSTSTTDTETARLHALLHFSHYRGIVAFLNFMSGTPDLEARRGELSAGWDGETVQWFDGANEEVSVHQFLRFPYEGFEVPDDLRSETDAALAAWVESFDSAFTDITTAHPQALADLEALAYRSKSLEALLCLEINRAWKVADQAFNTQGSEWVAEKPEILFEEIAAQRALLAVEYLTAIDDRLSRPGVDYLDGASATWEDSCVDGVTTDIEYIEVLASAGRDALDLYRYLRDEGYG